MASEIDNAYESFAADLMRGAPTIANFMKELGWGDGSPDQAYYAFRVKTWPICKIGKFLVASRLQMIKHAKKKTTPLPE
jgi:hypothetical protein